MEGRNYFLVVIPRFCRLSKKMKKEEREAQEEQEEAQSTNQAVTMRSFEKLWCEGWDSPCVETSVSLSPTVSNEVKSDLLPRCSRSAMRTRWSLRWRRDESWRRLILR